MAIVILGGLLSATALNMIVLPALYWMYGDRSVAVLGAEDVLVPEHRVHGAPVLATARSAIASTNEALPSS